MRRIDCVSCRSYRWLIQYSSHESKYANNVRPIRSGKYASPKCKKWLGAAASVELMSLEQSSFKNEMTCQDGVHLLYAVDFLGRIALAQAISRITTHFCLSSVTFVHPA